MEVLKFLWALFIAVDRVCNVLLLGDALHTISGRVGYNAKHHRNWFWISAEVFIDTLFFWEKHHCRRATAWEYKIGVRGRVKQGVHLFQTVKTT